MDARASRGWAPICLALMLIGSSRASPQEALPAPEDSPVLTWFDFEGEAVETGPYTLIAYEDARGSVRLTTRYRLSGFRSVEIRDVAGDGEFAELQGFFREMPRGKLYFHFAVLIALSEEPLNIALAGESQGRARPADHIPARSSPETFLRTALTAEAAPDAMRRKSVATVTKR